MSIALDLGMSESTLRHYFSPKGRWYESYRSWSSAELADIQLNVHSALIAEAIEAAQILVGLMRNGKPSVRLRAAESILDRAGFQKNSDGFTKVNSNLDRADHLFDWFEEYVYEKQTIPTSTN